MVRTRKSNSNDRHKKGEKVKKVEKITDFFDFSKSWKSRKVDTEKKARKFKSNSQNNLLHGNFSNDILISCSGQVKIDNLDSCLNLVSSDFIVF